MGTTKKIFGIITLGIFVYIAYNNIIELKELITNGWGNVTAKVTFSGIIFNFIDFIPLIFLAVLVNKNIPYTNIWPDVFFVGVATTLVLLFSNLDSPKIPKDGLSKDFFTKYMFYFSSFLVVLITGAISFIRFGKSIKKVVAYDKNLSGFKTLIQVCGVLLLTIIGVPFFPMLYALAYGLLGIFFLTTKIGDKKIETKEEKKNSSNVEAELASIKSKTNSI